MGLHRRLVPTAPLVVSAVVVAAVDAAALERRFAVLVARRFASVVDETSLSILHTDQSIENFYSGITGCSTGLSVVTI